MNQEIIEARKASKLEARKARKLENKQIKAEKAKEIQDLLKNHEIEVVYTYRSEIPPVIEATLTETSDYTTTETSKHKLNCHKVTVVGLTKKSGNQYKMLVGFSKYNPEDTYSKQVGYHEAIKNILLKEKFIVIGNLPTEFNKELFFNIAGSIVDKNEEIFAPEK